MKRFLEFGGVAAAAILVAFGVAAIVLGFQGKGTVIDSLKAEQITGTPDMTPKSIADEVKAAGLKNVSLPTCNVANQAVNTGARARCFAQYMRIHALESTGGFVYAQMGQYKAKPGTPKAQLTPDGATNNTQYAQTDPTTNLPVSNGARNVWVTETALTTALNTSYMADQLGNFGIVVGVALLLSGIGFLILALGGIKTDSWFFVWYSQRRSAKGKRSPAATA
jgi:cytoskeletal protein RodZ